MIKWIIFITLKVVEVSVVLFVPFYLGLFGSWLGLFNDDRPEHVRTVWLAGIATLIFIVGLLFIGALIIVAIGKLVDKNMEWAKSLSR